MGNTPSKKVTSEKQKTTPGNRPITSCIKKQSVLKESSSQKTINTRNISNKIDTNNIPEYQLKHKSQINNGVNQYQYFNHSIPKSDCLPNFGLDTKQDNKFSRSVDKLYSQELDYRYNVDCSKEIPYTSEDLETELGKNTVNGCTETHHENNYNRNNDNSNNHNSNDNNDNNGNDVSSEITITREEALKIKDNKYLSDLEKRLLIMNSIQLDKLDPLNIMIESKIRLNVLVEKYKSLLKIYHPDKRGSTEMFILINDALNNQKYIIQSKIMDKDFNQLKDDYTQFSDTRKKKKPLFFEQNVESFNSKKFNKFYDDHKFNDEYEDEGYGDMMVKGGIREDIDIEKIDISKDNTFQQQFEKKVSSASNDIVKYKVPKALNQYDTYTELCNKNKSGYTGKSSSIECYDYKEAFELANIKRDTLPDEISLKEYTKQRENDTLELSEEQQTAIEKDTEKCDDAEKTRQNNLIDYTINIDKYNDKINKVLLKN